MPSNTAKPSRLKTSEIFTLAAEYERQSEIEGRAKKSKKELQNSIASELLARKTKSLTYSDGTTVTRVQTETIVINGAALYGDLSAAQRRLVYRRTLNISELPKSAQAAIMAVLKNEGVAKQVKATLDEGLLAGAVQSGKIDAEVVAAHSEIRPNAPYIRISHGTGD